MFFLCNVIYYCSQTTRYSTWIAHILSFIHHWELFKTSAAASICLVICSNKSVKSTEHAEQQNVLTPRCNVPVTCSSCHWVLNQDLKWFMCGFLLKFLYYSWLPHSFPTGCDSPVRPGQTSGSHVIQIGWRIIFLPSSTQPGSWPAHAENVSDGCCHPFGSLVPLKWNL